MKKKRVFHGLVNYGTQSGYLAMGLRAEGFMAKSFTLPDKFNRVTDFCFKQRNTIISKLFYYKIWYPLIRTFCIFKFDIFHFYYGTSLWTNHKDLPILKFLGKKIVHHYLGHDVEQYKKTKEKYEFSNMDFWTDDEKGTLHDEKINKRFEYESKFTDFQVVCAPQYSQFVPNSIFVPLAIDLTKYNDTKLETKNYTKQNVLIIHAPTHRGVKGTQALIDAVDILKREGQNVDLKICENIPHSQLLEEYKKCDFSVVSLRGGWFGTAGIEAMASGRGIIAFLRDEYFEHIDEDYKKDLPIVSANIYTIYDVLKQTLQKKDFEKWGINSRRFVEKHHDLNKVAVRVKKIYENL